MEIASTTPPKKATPHIKVGRKTIRKMAIGDRLDVVATNPVSLRNNLYAMAAKEGPANGYKLSIVNEGNGILSITKQPISGSLDVLKKFLIEIRVALAQYGEMSEKELLHVVGAKGNEWEFFSALTELEDGKKILFNDCKYILY